MRNSHSMLNLRKRGRADSALSSASSAQRHMCHRVFDQLDIMAGVVMYSLCDIRDERLLLGRRSGGAVVSVSCLGCCLHARVYRCVSLRFVGVELSGG